MYMTNWRLRGQEKLNRRDADKEDGEAVRVLYFLASKSTM
jgi:hypothetical protein